MVLQIEDQQRTATETRAKVDEGIRESHARLKKLDKERKILAMKEADLAKEIAAIRPKKTDFLHKKTKAKLDVQELEAEVSKATLAYSQAQDELKSVKQEIQKQEQQLDQVCLGITWSFAVE